MSADILELVKGNQLPADFPKILRDLADRAERGEIESFVGAFVLHGQFSFALPSSLSDSLVLATLLKHHVLRRFET